LEGKEICRVYRGIRRFVQNKNFVDWQRRSFIFAKDDEKIPFGARSAKPGSSPSLAMWLNAINYRLFVRDCQGELF
ncbi:hypothetical protein OFM81_31075, partial [Escherichia coli]|nr:hypothetical protein [Escherichia coli]